MEQSVLNEEHVFARLVIFKSLSIDDSNHSGDLRLKVT